MNTNKAVYLRGLDHQLRMNGVSASELARRLNKSTAYHCNISNWRNLKGKATVQSLMAVAEALGCDPIDLLALPDIRRVFAELTYTLHTYLAEVREVGNAIAQLDVK